MTKTNELYQVLITNTQPNIENDCSFFFHSNAFIDRDSSPQTKFASLSHKGQSIATIPFVISENIASSLPKSPFGAFHTIPDITKSQLDYFTDNLLNQLRQQQINKIKITSFPKVYNPWLFDITHEVLTQAGFTISPNDTSQYLAVDCAFRKKIKASERRYLNNATSQGYAFKQLDIDNLDEVYELITLSRKNKGYPITMSFADLKATVEQFPQNYSIFGLYHNSIIIAGSVCIHVNNKILYNFYLGDNINYRKHSPAVPLIGEIYSYAQAKGYQIFDLGLSTDKGEINEGLFNFKSSLGAISTEKPTYILSL